MTEKEMIVLAMAESNLPACHLTHPKALTRFAKRILAYERRECADMIFDMVQDTSNEDHPAWVALHKAQQAIRERGQA
jgi:hypothetical protein